MILHQSSKSPSKVKGQQNKYIQFEERHRTLDDPDVIRNAGDPTDRRGLFTSGVVET